MFFIPLSYFIYFQAYFYLFFNIGFNSLNNGFLALNLSDFLKFYVTQDFIPGSLEFTLDALSLEKRIPVELSFVAGPICYI